MATKNKMPEKESEASSAFDCLAVTNVQVYPFQEGPSMGHTKGIASIVLNDQFMIRGLRVMDGENGLFVGYPVDLQGRIVPFHLQSGDSPASRAHRKLHP